MATYTGSDKRLAYLFEHGGGGGGSANIWTGTMADYIAQASQIADDTAVFITDDEIQSLIVSSYDIYSEDEKEVGVWINSKPLYQKTIGFGAIPANSINYQITLGLLNVDEITKIRATGNIGNSFFALPLLQSASLFSEYGVNVQAYDKSTDKLRIDTGSRMSLDSGYVTVQYTKTTDTAGSGLFVPSGAVAHHYSTTEQVVGTWVDGKPLYEKTIYIENPTAGEYYAHGVENVKRIIIHEVTGLRNGQWNCGIFNTNSGDRLTILAYPTSGNSGLYTDFSMTSLKDLYIVLRYTKTTD